MNNEINELKHSNERIEKLVPIARFYTRYQNVYAIIEDENFNRYGWYERGKRTE